LKVEQKGDGFEFKDDDAVKEISSVNPISDFKKMVSDRKVDRVSDALTQMQAMIERFIKNSLKGDLYGKAIECLRQMRQTCIQEDEAKKYNDFMRRIKSIFGRPGGSYMDFFTMLVDEDQSNRLTLITQKESTISSDVTEGEASKVIHFFLFITLL
jgi:hypothetical protein